MSCVPFVVRSMAVGAMVLGNLLTSGAASLFAQSAPYRPPSRVPFGDEMARDTGPAPRISETSSEEIPDDASDPVGGGETLPLRDWETSADDVAAGPVFFDEGFSDTTRFLEDRERCRWNARPLPNMQGDFFGAGTALLTVEGDELLNAAPGETFDPAGLGSGDETRFLLVSPGNSVVGRQKAAENNSPLPRDRVFVNYSYLANTSLQEGGIGVHRITPGIERTFAGEMFSWEMRVPMGITFDSDSVLTGGSSRDQAELGNLNLAVKGLLCSRPNWLLSAGLGATFPTADDLRFANSNGRELIHVENSAVHLLPYLAGAWSDGGWFAQSFLQLDYDLNGNPVQIDNGRGLSRVGDFEDADFLYWDIGVGYWLIKDRRGGLVSGIAPTLELHYNTAFDTAGGVRSDSGFQFGGHRGPVEVVNLLVGTTFELAGRNTLALGYVTPIGGGDDERFDGELRVLLNWYFGRN